MRDQVSRTEAGQGELDEELKETNTQLERYGQTIEQLEGQCGAGDIDGNERRKHC